MAWAHLTLVRMVVVVLYIPGEVVGLTGRPVVAGLEAVNVVVFARLFVLEEVNDVDIARSWALRTGEDSVVVAVIESSVGELAAVAAEEATNVEHVGEEATI